MTCYLEYHGRPVCELDFIVREALFGEVLVCQYGSLEAAEEARSRAEAFRGGETGLTLVRSKCPQWLETLRESVGEQG